MQICKHVWSNRGNKAVRTGGLGSAGTTEPCKTVRRGFVLLSILSVRAVSSKCNGASRYEPVAELVGRTVGEPPRSRFACFSRRAGRAVEFTPPRVRNSPGKQLASQRRLNGSWLVHYDSRLRRSSVSRRRSSCCLVCSSSQSTCCARVAKFFRSRYTHSPSGEATTKEGSPKMRAYDFA